MFDQINPVAMAVYNRLSMAPIAIAPQTQANLMADLINFAQMDTDPVKIAEAFEAKKQSLCASYGVGRASSDKPFAFANGVAIIPIHGSLINRFGASYGSVTGYNFIRSQVNAAKADPDVKAVVFDVNSNGGEVAGCQETAETIASLRGVKPSMAFADSRAYSAAYWTASAADKLIMTPSGGVGSIGAMCMHVDMSSALEKFGVKVTLLHAGEDKVKGNPFEPLDDDTKASMQSSLDLARSDFAQSVSTNRGLSLDAVMDTEARCYDAPDAIKLGLVDGVAHPSEAIGQFLGAQSADVTQTVQATATTKEESTMDETELAGIKQTATTEGATSERARISAIMGCDEAKGRESLANHIAFNTSMSVDDAKGMLAAAPLTAPAAEGNQAPATPFSQAMDKNNPNIPANEGAEATELSEADQTAANVASIMKAREMATGKKAK